LLARIYGLFTLKTRNFLPVDFMIMQSTAMLNKKENKRLAFDLKGSLIRRYKTCRGYGKSLEGGGTMYPPLMLDQNFIQLNKNGKLILTTNEDRNKLLEILEKDTLFLNKFNLVDYSLLIVTEKYE